MGHFEGRSWRGFHHHATMCIAAYGFLIAERLTAPKKTLAHSILGEVPALPKGFRPRGTPAQTTPRANSIPTLRLQLVAALLARLPSCPCCGRSIEYY